MSAIKPFACIIGVLRPFHIRAPIELPMEKKHILDEIRRTAAANGGTPLGRLQFFNETGIKEHDWRGVHWSRWSDAVSEAGLSPNQKTEAYDEKFLLDALAGLIRDIKRFPTGSDIRLRTRKGDGFPYDNTFRRIGSKAEISAKLIAHLNGRPGFENVVTVCEPLAETLIPQSSTDFKGGKFKEGFVYLLRSGRRYKIGATNDLATRSKAIAVQMPDPTETVHVIHMVTNDLRVLTFLARPHRKFHSPTILESLAALGGW